MFFATVEDSFQITGRGCVIVSSQPRSPELRQELKTVFTSDIPMDES